MLFGNVRDESQRMGRNKSGCPRGQSHFQYLGSEGTGASGGSSRLSANVCTFSVPPRCGIAHQPQLARPFFNTSSRPAALLCMVKRQVIQKSETKQTIEYFTVLQLISLQ